MKKIEKIHADEERKRKEFIRRMEYEKHKRGITKKRDDYELTKMKKYVKNMNEMYSVINPTKRIELAIGNKTEGKRYCSTKSQWQYRIEQEIRDGKRKIDLNPEKNRKAVEIPYRLEKIMLIINKKVYVKDVEVKPYKKICYGKIKFGKEKQIVRLENIYPEEKEIYQTPYGEMTGETLLRISISTGVRIYEMT